MIAKNPPVLTVLVSAAGVLLGLSLLRLNSKFNILYTKTQGGFVNTLSKLTNQVWRISLPLNRPFICGDKQISASWLTQVLIEKQILPNHVKVSEAVIEDLQGNRGLSGAVSRIQLKYSETSSSYPASLILKVAPRTSSYQHREALFYEKFGEEFAEWIPKVIYSSASFSKGMVIILEDCSLQPNAVPTNFFFGNQIWGLPEDFKEKHPSPNQLEKLEEMFSLCAEIHFKHWNDYSLLRIPWLKNSQWYRGKSRGLWEGSIQLAFNYWEKFKKSDLFNSPELQWSDKLTKIIDRSFENTTWNALQRHLSDPRIPFTLTHGDFHASNTIWVENDTNPIRLFDWAEVGPWEPTTDLGQTMISDVRPEIWRGQDERLLQIYWKKLISLGVRREEYPFERCLARYQQAGVERWIWILCVLVSFPLPVSSLQYFHDQLLTFIEEHGDFPHYQLKPVVCF